MENDWMYKSYNEETIAQFNKSILEDHFDDEKQNKVNYDKKVSGDKELKELLRREELNVAILNVGSGSHKLFEHCYNLEPCASRMTKDTTPGWCENMQTKKIFDVLICWGVLCFVRSLPETLIQFNNRLQIGGKCIVDIVSFTNMPLAQTAHPDSFIRCASLFGFELEERIPFGPNMHKRIGFRFVKQRNFDYRYLMIPQTTGEINNFLEERDWFLK